MSRTSDQPSTGGAGAGSDRWPSPGYLAAVESLPDFLSPAASAFLSSLAPSLALADESASASSFLSPSFLSPSLPSPSLPSGSLAGPALRGFLTLSPAATPSRISTMLPSDRPSLTGFLT